MINMMLMFEPYKRFLCECFAVLLQEKKTGNYRQIKMNDIPQTELQ